MTMKQLLEYLMTFIKCCKKPYYIVVTKSKLICVNEELSVMYTMNILVEPCVEIAATIDDINKGLNDENFMFHDAKIYFMIMEFLRKYESYNNIIYYCEDFKASEEISKLTTMKVKDGSVMYNLDDRVLLPFFSGLIPLTKTDGLDLTIYGVSETESAIKYTIHKKKIKTDIDLYFCLMNL